MIDALDHIALAVKSRDAGIGAYAVLLGRRPQDAAFQLANVRLDFSASATSEQGLSALAFAVRDIVKARHLLERRALPVLEAEAGAAGAPRALRIAPAGTHQVPVTLVERNPNADRPEPSPLAAAAANDAVSGLDHVVIRSPNPERAIALYAGRLGLSLRLDRSEPTWGARLIFLRCGDLIVEVAHDLKAGIGDGPDRLWGLSWRVPDIAAAHTRLRTAGVDVSDLRAGRRPGTRVFTAKSHTAGVPTLMIGPAGGERDRLAAG
jgi:catechol 2,3-dioxygenase-like lactoylglutathione lyase family enzyme